MNHQGAVRKANGPRSRSRKQEYPAGWDEKKVQKLIDHYDNLTDELAAEIEAAPAVGKTLMEVPTELVPAIHKLVARHEKGKGRSAKR